MKTMEEKPLILVVNDDGYSAPGIAALVEAVSELGEVILVAPDKPMSGMGHAITLNSSLRIAEVSVKGATKAFSCSGTPVDCVKFGTKKLAYRKIDLLVSGINHGSNSSVNVIYSGTMSAAVEGALEGIPSIGFSLCDHSIDADFSACKTIVKSVASKVLKNGLPEGTCLNVNIPKLKSDELKGIKICRQCIAYWDEDFEERKDPFGNSYYWLTGKFINKDNKDDTDEWALANGYVSIVPVQSDFTNHSMIKSLEEDGYSEV
jgi:5'-nucleotidase